MFEAASKALVIEAKVNARKDHEHHDRHIDRRRLISANACIARGKTAGSDRRKTMASTELTKDGLRLADYRYILH